MVTTDCLAKQCSVYRTPQCYFMHAIVIEAFNVPPQTKTKTWKVGKNLKSGEIMY